jgi:hypothetical protein
MNKITCLKIYIYGMCIVVILSP